MSLQKLNSFSFLSRLIPSFIPRGKPCIWECFCVSACVSGILLMLTIVLQTHGRTRHNAHCIRLQTEMKMRAKFPKSVHSSWLPNLDVRQSLLNHFAFVTFRYSSQNISCLKYFSSLYNFFKNFNKFWIFKLFGF